MFIVNLLVAINMVEISTEVAVGEEFLKDLTNNLRPIRSHKQEELTYN